MKQVEVSREFLEEYNALVELHTTSYYALSRVEYNPRHYPKVHERMFDSICDRESNKRLSEFAEAWCNDIEYVVKEKLYYVRLPKLGYMRKSELYPLTSHVEDASKYSELEIKAIDPAFWNPAFLVEVE